MLPHQVIRDGAIEDSLCQRQLARLFQTVDCGQQQIIVAHFAHLFDYGVGAIEAICLGKLLQVSNRQVFVVRTSGGNHRHQKDNCYV